MRINVVEVAEGGALFQDKHGFFVSSYFPYFQVLGRPQVTEEALGQAVPLGAFTAVSGNLNDKEAKFKEIFARVAGMGPNLWQPHAMHGAEYEGGGFQAYVARAAMKGGMVAAEMDVSVNTRIKPSVQAQSYMDVVKSLRKEWQDKYRVKLPEGSLDTKVYVIAPKDKIDAAQWMIRDFARDAVEHGSHRGLGFNRAAAYESLSDEDKKKVGDHNNVAWFEIHQGVFFTIDKDMAEKAKIAFGATDYDLRREPEAAKGWKRFLPRALGG